ncbi:Uncharacterized protein APZ42_005583 [Daphnia magna]|uniref:Uncharacterized protein n=1 Tax=Daphnia magna TaxID=35525 RepID=A0A162BXZ4_9CRUS|nr:Uncharacterized protein APZ42_005583 [Daphnia magna]
MWRKMTFIKVIMFILTKISNGNVLIEVCVDISGYTPLLLLLPALELFRNHVHLVSSPRRSLVSQLIYPLPLLQFRPFEGLIPFGPT